MSVEETCEVCGRVDVRGFQCWRVGHLLNKATAKAHPEYAIPVEREAMIETTAIAPRSVNEKYRVGPDLLEEIDAKIAFPLGCAVASPKRPAGYGKLGIVVGRWRERDGAPWCLIVAGDRELGIFACGEMEKVLSKDEVDDKVDVSAWGIR